MKSRSELFSIFQSFYNEIQTQFGVSIRTFRSDNAREYLSHSFKAFMASHGILHQTSCAYTPQQNGVAERKNRHLIETTRTLLLHGHVPQTFWGDALLTACYLINRMSSSVLNNQIPHSILFPSQPLQFPHLGFQPILWALEVEIIGVSFSSSIFLQNIIELHSLHFSNDLVPTRQSNGQDRDRYEV